MAWPMAVPRAVVQLSIAVEQRVLVGGRRDQQRRDAGERDQPDAGAAVLVLHELPRRLAARGQPVRLDVGGAHRAGNVDRQQDRGGVRRHGHATPAAGPPPPASASRPAANRMTGIRRRHSDRPGSAARISATLETLSATRLRRLHPPAREQQRHGQQREQRPRPTERHQTILPCQRIISSAPAASSSRASPATGPVSSTGSSLAVSRRSIERVDLVQRAGVAAGSVAPAGGSAMPAAPASFERGGELVARRPRPWRRRRCRRRRSGCAPRRRRPVGGRLGAPGRRCPRRRRSTTMRRRTPVAERRAAAAPSSRQGDRLAGDRGQRGQDRLRQRGAAGRGQPVDRGERRRVVVGGRLRGQRLVAEDDHADVDRVRLVLDEARRGRLRGGQPGRLEVLGRHAVGDVEDQHHRAGRRGARSTVACGRARPPSSNGSAASSNSVGQVPAHGGPPRPAGATTPEARPGPRCGVAGASGTPSTAAAVTIDGHHEHDRIPHAHRRPDCSTRSTRACSRS